MAFVHGYYFSLGGEGGPGGMLSAKPSMNLTGRLEIISLLSGNIDTKLNWRTIKVFII